MVVRATNKTGSTITNGQVVIVSSAQGNRPVISLAQADTEGTSHGTLGFATHDIADNGTGYITAFGLVRDVDTSGFSAGDVLYLSAATAGGVVNTPPSSPDHSVTLGIALNSNNESGIIFANVQDGFEIYELHDVDSSLIAPTDQGLLYWDDAALIWKQSSDLKWANANSLLDVNGHVLSNKSHGELYENNVTGGTDITVVTAGTYVQWVSSTAGDTTGGNYIVADVGADDLTIGSLGEGDYQVSFKADSESTPGLCNQWAVFKNGSITHIYGRATTPDAALIPPTGDNVQVGTTITGSY
jgi:hypothetical protein